MLYMPQLCAILLLQKVPHMDNSYLELDANTLIRMIRMQIYVMRKPETMYKKSNSTTLFQSFLPQLTQGHTQNFPYLCMQPEYDAKSNHNVQNHI